MNIFNFFKGGSSVPYLEDSEIIKKCRERLSLDEFLELRLETIEEKRNGKLIYRYIELDGSFEEFSKELKWIIAIKMIDAICINKYMAPKICLLSKDILFLECLHFLLLLPTFLHSYQYLKDDDFDESAELDESFKEVENVFNFSQHEFNDFSEMRIEQFELISGNGVTNELLASSSLLTTILRSRITNQSNEILKTDLIDLHIALDYNLTERDIINGIVSQFLEELITILQKVVNNKAY